MFDLLLAQVWGHLFEDAKTTMGSISMSYVVCSAHALSFICIDLHAPTCCWLLSPVQFSHISTNWFSSLGTVCRILMWSPCSWRTFLIYRTFIFVGIWVFSLWNFRLDFPKWKMYHSLQKCIWIIIHIIIHMSCCWRIIFLLSQIDSN